MNILVDSSPVVKPYVSIKQHKGTKLWYPVCVMSRGTFNIPKAVQTRLPAGAALAAYEYGYPRGMEYHEPEQPVMIVLCSWCREKGKKTVVSIKPCLPHQVGEDYGGICPECAAEKEAELRADGAPDDLVESFVEWAGGEVGYSHEAWKIEQGVNEGTDWRG